MELSRKNLFVKYYKFAYNNEPKDICSLFWGSFIALILGPFVFPGILIITNNYEFRYSRGISRLAISSVVMVMIYGIMFVIGQLGNIFLRILGYQFIHWTGIVFGGLGLGLLVLTIFIGIGIGIWYIFDKISKDREEKRQLRYLEELTNSPSNEIKIKKKTSFIQNLIDIFAAIRGKYCIKITYTN